MVREREPLGWCELGVLSSSVRMNVREKEDSNMYVDYRYSDAPHHVALIFTPKEVEESRLKELFDDYMAGNTTPYGLLVLLAASYKPKKEV